ncbi:uncharacterized protein EV420DRAFT_1589018 [Desarmillaria tabescens]|uniref:MYND-type domain-containing protein n=1 Tax=Armillaria tabescens TaxID=1929756 RepID=A0AA39MK14_ARMTA|nr:uncharacterized protein EV420DRAFT_1589018 [Desarmillaria tabescens]KAK0437147.1 hypothetical protein EV420DRAFT_1589018 [Desarmillaria tabescens]
MPSHYFIYNKHIINNLESKPERVCHFLQCPRKEKGYEGKKMRMCGKCQYIRYCSEACQKSDWRRHREYCREKLRFIDGSAWVEEHRWIFEWATLEALRVHTTDDLLHSFLQLDVMYGDLTRLGGRPEQTIFLSKASVTPFSEAPWLTNMEVDNKEAQEIRDNGGTGRAFAFVCFRWERDGRMMAFPLRIDLTALTTPGYQHISAWKPILYGVVREQISMDELAQDILQAGSTTSSMNLNDMDFEDIIDDMGMLSMDA